MASISKHLAGLARAGGLIARTATSALWPVVPPYLIFFITHRCNARCPFCFDRGQDPDTRSEGGELSLAEIERAAAAFKGVLHVTVTGGEPFLRDDVALIAQAFVRCGARSLTIASNGIRTDRIVSAVSAILEAAPGLFFDLDLSVDGPADVHDRLRGVKGAYQAVMDTAGSLSGWQERFPGFRVGATVTLSAFNRDVAADTVMALAQTGLFRRVQVLWVRGRPFDPAALDADFFVYEQCLEFLQKQRLGRGIGRIKEALSSRVREVVSETVREGRGVIACRAGLSMVTLDADGRVYPCEMLEQLFPGADPRSGIGSWALGSLREHDYDIRKVVQSAQAGKVLDWINKKGCYCSFECAAYNNIVFNPRQWPGVLRRVLMA